jgi:uncharacterized RDD family membrane protein YckC
MNSAYRVSFTAPGGLRYECTLAHPVLRGLAWLTDLCVVIVIMNFFQVMTNLLVIIEKDLATAFSILLYFCLSLSYGILCEWLWNGQTVGKRLFRLRVVDVKGLPLQFSQIFMRNLLRFIDALPIFYLVGGICATFSKKVQRLGDLAAGTIVMVIEQNSIEKSAVQLNNTFNSLKQFPVWIARIRNSLEPAECNILLRAIHRAETLNDHDRIRFFKTLATDLRLRLNLPQDLLPHCPDEQLIKNIVEVLSICY